MSTKFFTNQDDNSLLKKFEGVFANIESIQHFDALVGYFRASGYFKLRPFLDRIQKIRILVGINVDKLTQEYNAKGQMFLSNPDRTKEEFVEEMLAHIQESEYDAATEEDIVQFLDDLVSEKIEMRAHPDKTIHAKIYIFRPENFNEYGPCEVITGSSNLTDSGLGTYADANYEFNVSLRDYDDVKFATDEFEKLWKESHPILQAEAEALRRRSYLAGTFTPYEIYVKLLMEYFGKRVNYDPYNIDLLLPDKYIRLKYQSDAANQGYAMMMKHNGFILADVVGLGKTIVALMVAKKFIYENGTHSNILIVAPPSLESSWRKTAADFLIDRHVHVVTTGSLHKVLDPELYEHKFLSPERYDLIIIDESHKFRNEWTNHYEQLQHICKTRRTVADEWGNTRKKVILVTATPLNNSPSDIETQVYLFQDPRNSTLEIKNLQQFFKPLKEEYKRIQSEKPLDLPRVKRVFEKIRDGVVEPLVIRRTRRDIENDPDYMADLKEQGITFPKVVPPKEIRYAFDDELSKLFYDTITYLTGRDEDDNVTAGIGYYRYRAIEFLASQEDREAFGDVESIAKRLSEIMKTLLVKRLESSFYAFKKSLQRFKKANDNMLSWFKDNRIPIAPDMDVNSYLEEHTMEELEARMNDKGGNSKMFKVKDFDEDFITGLRKDKRYIDELVRRWEDIGEEDPKRDEFFAQLKPTFLDPKKNKSGKLVIFTESKETASYIRDNLEQRKFKKVLCIDAKNRKAMQNTIAENFDANWDREQKDDFDIIITTEVLAEGVNLHRSNTILNYDVPWNSTKLMQRIGRVNRIGTTAKYVYVYNFYPTDHAENQIHLSDIAIRKLQAFHSAFGEDNKIYSLLEEIGEGALHGPGLIEEESEILKYLLELREFRKAHPKLFTKISRMPHRARVGRSTPNESQTEYPLVGSTVAYLKSELHSGVFYYVSKENTPDELSFLQAVRMFKCKPDEEATKLHERHHEHVKAALELFRSDLHEQVVETITRKSLNVAENQAISNIQMVMGGAPTPQKKTALHATIELIKKATIRGLAKDINKCFKSHSLKDVPLFLDTLFKEVLDRYKIQIDPDTAPVARTIQKPYIVLTESFTD